MEKSEVLRGIDEFEKNPNNPEFCDALCDAAEYLGWPEGEYSVEELREAVEEAE
jgi:hypothetical protein